MIGALASETYYKCRTYIGAAAKSDEGISDPIEIWR
jgi:hypothetical protein